MDYHAKLWARLIVGYFLEHNPRGLMKSLAVCRCLFVLAHLVTNHGLHMSNKISCMRFASDLCSSECEQWFHCEMHGIHEHRKSDFHGLMICRHSRKYYFYWVIFLLSHPLTKTFFLNISLQKQGISITLLHFLLSLSLSLKKKKSAAFSSVCITQNAFSSTIEYHSYVFTGTHVMHNSMAQ